MQLCNTTVFLISLWSAAQKAPPLHAPKSSAKSSTLQTILAVDMENKIEQVPSNNIESPALEKIYSNFKFMTPTNFDVEILKKKTFHKLPTYPLKGNGLFSHIVKFLYNSSKEMELLYAVTLLKCAVLNFCVSGMHKHAKFD